jgi:hypothetical protein
MTTLCLQSYHEKKDMGYAKRNKGHPQESMKRKERIGHMKFLEKKDSPYPRKKIKERWFMKRTSYIHPPKLPAHMYILIKVYDLTKYEEQVCLQILSTYYQTRGHGTGYIT